jgi:2-isopropylmalate synthase
MDKVVIFDTTLRDGEQAPGMSMGPVAKLRIARKLTDLRVDVIEAGFPASSETDAEAVNKIARELGGDVAIACLCRARAEDVEKGARALEPAANKRLHVFVPCSDLHISAKLESSREAVRDAAVRGISQARQFTDDVQFGLEDASRADRDYLAELISAGIAAGATTVAIADTVGYLTPWETGQFVADLYSRVPQLGAVTLSVHCHNDLGMGVTNSLAGLRSGARQVECTINGIGERAGNSSLEEVIMSLTTRPNFFGLTTGIDTTQLVPASRLLSETIGVPIQPNKAIVGENAFAHEAGIHQHGVLVNPLTYEIMTPESVGAESSRLVFGRHSGRRALAAILEQHAVALPAGQVDELMRWLKAQTITTDKPVAVSAILDQAREMTDGARVGQQDSEYTTT